MREYVCCYVKPSTPGQCLLILKSKPEWQKGKLNLVGGKIEPGETVQQAACRELEEEASIVGADFKIKGCLVHGDNLIWFLTCLQQTPLRSRTEEPVSWYWVDDVLNNRPHIPNLKLIIPLLSADAPDWKLTETDTGLLYQSACWRA